MTTQTLQPSHTNHATVSDQHVYHRPHAGATELNQQQRDLAVAPKKYDGILLASFGGPEGQEDVIPFLKNVTAGKGIPDERLEEVAHHYRENGGVSPINDQNRALKKALEEEFFRRGIDLPIVWANRNWDPFYNEVLEKAHADGLDNLLMLTTSAYTCYSSSRQYREDVGTALKELGLSGQMNVDKIRQYFDHPGFIMPFVEGLKTSLDELKNDPKNKHTSDQEFVDVTNIMFCTHSIPLSDAAAAGPRDIEFAGGSAYVAQHLAVMDVVMAELYKIAPEYQGLKYELVYQSRSGPPEVPWLEPDVNDRVEELVGIENIVYVPLGFVSDHMEVMWDLDTEAMETAQENGILALRSATPGTHPQFISGLVDLILERSIIDSSTPDTSEVSDIQYDQRQAMTELGPWYDFAPKESSSNRYEYKPTIAGID